MADKKISQLTELETSVDDDLLPIVDVTTPAETKKTTKGNFLKGVKWIHDYTPEEAVNGTNTVFTIPTTASQVIVYADGIRVKGSGETYTFSGGDTITFESGLQPMSSLSIDYLPN